MSRLLRYISTLAMRFSRQFFLVVFCILMLGGVSRGIVLERVVAIIGDSPVFLSELLEFKRKHLPDGSALSDEEVLQKLIDRKLLLMEARRLRLDTIMGDDMDSDALIERYLKLAISTFMPDIRMKKGLNDNFSDGTITKEDEFNRRLRNKITDLRKQYDIRVFPVM